MDPYAHTESFTSNLQHHVYDPLVRRNRKLEIEPALATILEDRQRRTAGASRCGQGVKFHNGDAFTADDVVASITRLLDPGRTRTRQPVERGQGREGRRHDRRLRPQRALPAAAQRPLRHLHHGQGVARGERRDEARQHLDRRHDLRVHARQRHGTVQAGELPAGLKTVLVVNENWWDKPEHNLKRIEFRPIKSDATRVAALLSGELDMVAPAPLQDLARIAAAPGFKVVEDPSLRLIFLGLNWRPELLGGAGQKNPLLDLKVRQALWHGVDLDRSRSASCAASPAPSAPSSRRRCPATPPTLDKPLAYDPEKAKKLLAEAGYPNGFKVGLACSNDRYIADEQTCVAIAAMWTRIGVQVDLKTESRTTYFPKVDRGETDIYMLGWATLPPMDGYSVLSAILATAQGRLRRQQPERPRQRAARRAHQARRRGARRAQAQGHADGSADDRA